MGQVPFSSSTIFKGERGKILKRRNLNKVGDFKSGAGGVNWEVEGLEIYIKRVIGEVVLIREIPW